MDHDLDLSRLLLQIDEWWDTFAICEGDGVAYVPLETAECLSAAVNYVLTNNVCALRQAPL